MSKTILISEKQLDSLQKNITKNKISENVAITDWLSPDERYVIFLDELYDLKEKKLLGDVWKNFDNMKLFLKHSFLQSSNVPKTIKESCLKGLNKMVISESNNDYSILKPTVKKIISEGFWDDVWDKTKSVGSDLWSSAKETGSDIVKGAKDLGSAISDGDYKEALRIIGKGVLYLARKIRSALHSPVGLILDTILIITGIGKTIQWIPWAIVVALDIYELSSGDYEDKSQPQWIRILLFSCDVLGLVLSGLVATGAMKFILRHAFKYATMGAFLKGMRNDREGQEYLTKMEQVYGRGGIDSRLGMAENYVMTKNPKIGGFIGEQRQNSSILATMFQEEVQLPAAMELQNSNKTDNAMSLLQSKKTEKPSMSKNIMKMFGIDL